MANWGRTNMVSVIFFFRQIKYSFESFLNLNVSIK